MTILQGVMWFPAGLVLVSIANIFTALLVSYWERSDPEFHKDNGGDPYAQSDQVRLQNMEEGYALRSPGSPLIFAMGGSMGNTSLLIAYHDAIVESKEQAIKERKRS